jgi:hypothetical protein
MPSVKHEDAEMAVELCANGVTECQKQWLLKFIGEYSFLPAA